MRRIHWGHTILILATLGFATSMAISFANLKKYEEIGRAELSDTTWIVAQTKIDYHRLMVALDRYAHDIDEITKDQLIIRLNAFWSRLPLYLHGEEGGKFRPMTSVLSTINESIAVLQDVLPQIETLEPGDIGKYRVIRQSLDALDRPLSQIIVDVLVHDEGDTIFRNDSLEKVEVELFVASVGTLFMGGILLVMLLVEGRTSRRAQDATQVARTQLEEAIASISEGFVLYDPDDRLVLSNQRFDAMFSTQGAPAPAGLQPGARFEQLVRESVDSGKLPLAPAERDQWLVRRLAQHADPGEPFELQLADGRWIRVSERRTAAGGFVGVRTDITEQKRREEALMAAKEEAEMANRAKTEFLATMSHELRTPLNAIIGFSEIMEGQILGPIGSPQYAGYAKAIRESGHHLLSIICDILDIARVESGRIELHEEAVDLRDVLRSTIRLMRERASNSDVDLTSEAPDDLPEIFADARLTKQALINLLSNAVKFTPKGGSVSASIATRDGGVAIEVRDTGIGIAEEDLGRVIEPFVQLESALSRKHDGTGLGLPLVNSIAELHGGTFVLRSAPLQGTIATIWFPPDRVLRLTGSTPPPPQDEPYPETVRVTAIS